MTGPPENAKSATGQEDASSQTTKLDLHPDNNGGAVKSKYQRHWRGISPNAEKPYAWFSVEAATRCLEVSDKAGLAVYVALCSLEARTAERFKPSFFASRPEIARASGVSKNYLTRILRTLEAAKLIQVKRPTGKAKIEHEANQYTILSRLPQGTKQGLPKERKRDSQKTTDSEENRDSIKSILCVSREDTKESGRSACRSSANAGPPAAAREMKKITSGAEAWKQHMEDGE